MSRRAINVYGRLAVGQRVRYERITPAPGSGWGRGMVSVTLRTEHVITGMWDSESGALVELTDADGCRLSRCFNSYGQEWGGFGGLDKLADAPQQMSLIRRAA